MVPAYGYAPPQARLRRCGAEGRQASASVTGGKKNGRYKRPSKGAEFEEEVLRRLGRRVVLPFYGSAKVLVRQRLAGEDISLRISPVHTAVEADIRRSKTRFFFRVLVTLDGYRVITAEIGLCLAKREFPVLLTAVGLPYLVCGFAGLGADKSLATRFEVRYR